MEKCDLHHRQAIWMPYWNGQITPLIIGMVGQNYLVKKKKKERDVGLKKKVGEFGRIKII
jgi:hypothetical protein